MRRALLLAVLAGLLLAGGATSAPPAVGRFLLVYVAGGEQHVAQSRDGVRWTALPGFAAPAGEGPSAVRRAGRLYLVDMLRAAPDGIGGELRRFRIGSSAPAEEAPVSFLARLATPEDAARAAAITGSIALDAAGRLTLVYALRFEPETNACPVAGQSCVKLRTATEVAGTDGAELTGDPGNRAVVGLDAGQDAGDPAALATAKGQLVLLAGPGGCLRLFTAVDLHRTYRPGGCLSQGVVESTPSGAYRPFLKEHWLYAVSGGRVLRAITRTLKKPLAARRFRPLQLPGSPAVTSARFVLNSS